MRKEIMKKWVKALRSGKFKQGMGTLKQFNSKGQPQHCCLGVLCELYNQDMKKSKKKILPEKFCNDTHNMFAFGRTKFGPKKEDLPKQVMKWAGMSTSMGEYFSKEDDLTIDLACVNDTGQKFKTIANIIEKHWENL